MVLGTGHLALPLRLLAGWGHHVHVLVAMGGITSFSSPRGGSHPGQRPLVSELVPTPENKSSFLRVGVTLSHCRPHHLW